MLALASCLAARWRRTDKMAGNPNANEGGAGKKVSVSCVGTNEN
jgi:hypothetical protein